jgi:hypothetical protein
MVRDQLNNYQRNLSEMAKSMTRHTSKTIVRESRFTMSRLFWEKSKSCLMMAAGLKSPAQLHTAFQQAASRVFNQKWLSDCGPKQSKLRRASTPHSA